MTIPVKDVTIYKGTDKDIPIYVADSDGAVDLTSDILHFYVSETVSGTPFMTKDSAGVGGIVIAVDQGTNKGEAILTIDDDDTISVINDRYYYKLIHENASGKKKAILTGYFWVMEIAPSLVDEIRDLLGDGGELRVEKITDEMLYPANLNTIYVTRQRVSGVEGVWLFADNTHAGTNYYSGGGFNSNTGKVWFGTKLLATTQAVRVNYTWESGISDDALYRHLFNARLFTINYTGIDFSFGNCTTNETKGAEAMSMAGAILGAILTINGANVAQMGYNFRLDEFEIQTKLWGEGMIAESLFNIYIKEYEKWIQALGKAGQVYVTNRTLATTKYNIETLVGYTNPLYEGAER